LYALFTSQNLGCFSNSFFFFSPFDWFFSTYISLLWIKSTQLSSDYKQVLTYSIFKFFIPLLDHYSLNSSSLDNSLVPENSLIPPYFILHSFLILTIFYDKNFQDISISQQMCNKFQIPNNNNSIVENAHPSSYLFYLNDVYNSFQKSSNRFDFITSQNKLQLSPSSYIFSRTSPYSTSQTSSSSLYYSLFNTNSILYNSILFFLSKFLVINKSCGICHDVNFDISFNNEDIRKIFFYGSDDLVDDNAKIVKEENMGIYSLSEGKNNAINNLLDINIKKEEQELKEEDFNLGLPDIGREKIINRNFNFEDLLRKGSEFASFIASLSSPSFSSNQQNFNKFINFLTQSSDDFLSYLLQLHTLFQSLPQPQSFFR
jgi:hypothetical protein